MRRPSFNLLADGWIPVALDGRTPRVRGEQRDVGLAEALMYAHEMRALAEPSATVMVALLRLLLAVLHRVFGPATEASWDATWQAGRFDGEALAAYFARVESRFELFDPQWPWGQAAGLPEESAGPISKLAPERASGRQATLFSHQRDDDEEALTPAAAARRLAAFHQFCLSGSCGDGVGLRGVPAGPLTNVALFMPQGDNLWQTLLLNLVPYDPGDARRLGAGWDDAPAWEQDDRPELDAPPSGYLDLLTWQPRQVLLVPECHGGEWTVSRAVVRPGRTALVRALACDPMAGYRTGDTQPPVWMPVRPREQYGWWQYAARALRPSTACWRQPLVLQALARRTARGAAPREARLRLTIVGLVADRARVACCLREDMALPAGCLDDPEVLADLELALNAAERAQATLSRALVEADAGPAAGTSATGMEGALGMLPARLTGSVEQRGEVLQGWAHACLCDASRAWAAGVQRLGRRRSSWQQQALAEAQMTRRLRRELAPLLGGGDA